MNKLLQKHQSRFRSSFQDRGFLKSINENQYPKRLYIIIILGYIRQCTCNAIRVYFSVSQNTVLKLQICLKLFIIHLKFTKPSVDHLPMAQNKMQKVINIFMLVVWIGMCENLTTSSVSSKIDELQKIRTSIMYKHMGHI